ncbi:hypothetical protein BDZ45DRAFT_753758 [Acephala macrosclerotiorum]|nr:hypothetical protein BDZ45DRAFT_753758 [Acephala macrosclerotiorum]
MAKLDSYLNFDLHKHPSDEPFALETDTFGGQGICAMMNGVKLHEAEAIAPRVLAQKMSFCGFFQMPVGTPEMVADVFEGRMNNADTALD